MDDSTMVLLGVVGVITANQLVLRVGALRSRAVIFWALQVLNMVVIVYLMVWRLPGFEGFPIMSWVLGLLLAFRVIQNNGLRSRYLRIEQKNEQAARRRQASALLDGLDASRGDGVEDPTDPEES